MLIINGTVVPREVQAMGDEEVAKYAKDPEAYEKKMAKAREAQEAASVAVPDAQESAGAPVAEDSDSRPTEGKKKTLSKKGGES